MCNQQYEGWRNVFTGSRKKFDCASMYIYVLTDLRCLSRVTFHARLNIYIRIYVYDTHLYIKIDIYIYLRIIYIYIYVCTYRETQS